MDFVQHVLGMDEVKQLEVLSTEHFLIIFETLEGKILTTRISDFNTLSVQAPSIPTILTWLYSRCNHCSRAVIAHNHPSECLFSCLPSNEDIAYSELFRWQMAAVGIDLVDSIIIGKKKHWSFREHGLLQNKTINCSGVDLTTFITACLLQLSTILPEYYNDIENLINDLQVLQNEVNLVKKRPLHKRIFSKPPPLNPLFSHQSDPLLNRIISKLKEMDLTRVNRVEFQHLLSFGRCVQKKIFTYHLRTEDRNPTVL